MQLQRLFRRVWGVPLLAILVVAVTLVATAVVYVIVDIHSERHAKAQFEAYNKLLVSKLAHHLDDYAQVLHGAAGLFNASEEVTRSEWSRYVDSLNLEKYYPGIELMGYVGAKEKTKYAAIAYEQPSHPITDSVFKPDASAETARQEAMYTALAENNVSMTKKLVLVEGDHGKKQLGFLMLFPVYQKGMKLESLDDRKRALQGYVYSVFRSKDFLQEITKLFDEYLEVHVYDGADTTTRDLIYQSMNKQEAENMYAKFQSSNQMLVGNHVWSVSAQLKDPGGDLIYSDSSSSIWMLGILMSIILFAFSWALIVYRGRTQAIEKAQLPVTNKQPIFFYKIFHELRTPLHNILTLSKILSDNKESNLTNKQVEQAEVIHQAGVDLLEMIDEVMNLSRIRAGKVSVHFDEINIREFAKDVNLSFEGMANAKSLSFHVVVDPSVPVFMYNDYKKMYQIMKNLCFNAIKFTGKGSVSVRFYLAELVDCLAISVTDTGCGIPAHRLKSIFELYEQGDATIPEHRDGVGLGLTIAMEIAKMLAGEIRVESEENKGSCFTVYFPMNSTLKEQ